MFPQKDVIFVDVGNIYHPWSHDDFMQANLDRMEFIPGPCLVHHTKLHRMDVLQSSVWK